MAESSRSRRRTKAKQNFNKNSLPHVLATDPPPHLPPPMPLLLLVLVIVVQLFAKVVLSI